MYEALDAGCVPVLINQFGNPGSPSAAVQYQFLGGRKTGPPPFLWADTPAQLRGQIAALRADASALDGLQRLTSTWWNATLTFLRARVVNHGWDVRTSLASACNG
jgi:hypothetical protein